MRGRVAELGGYGEPIQIKEYEVPEPEPGGLIAKVEQASICGSDLHIWRGETVHTAADPIQLGFGHEGFGRIVALGEGTVSDDAGQALAIGDRVVHAVMPKTTGGRYVDPNLNRTYGQFPYFFTTFADYYYIGANRAVYRVPDELPDDILPPVNCAMGAAVGALVNGGVGFGSNVVVMGAGGLGLTATAAARAMGASRVVVFDRMEDRLELARHFGADHTVNVDEVPSADERVELVGKLTSGRGADVVLEFVGHAPLLAEGVRMLAPKGCFVEVGLWFPGNAPPFDPAHVFKGSRRIIGSSAYPHTLLPAILDFLVRTRDSLPWDRLVSHRFALSDVQEAFERADWADPSGGRVTRAVLVP